MKKAKRKHSLKVLTAMMFVITFMVWLILLFMKVLVWGISMSELFDEVISNILGIIPPILIFDFIYEYITKDHIAEEVSEQITQTLVGSSDAIDVFKDEDKVRFVQNTVKHIVGEESSEMVNAVIEPYITKKYSIRHFFKYTIILRDYLNNPMFDSAKYLKVYEDLKYKKSYIGNNNLGNEVSVAFILKDHLLDEALRNQKFIFQENLLINDAEMQQLMALSESDKLSFVEKEMQFSIYIDEMQCKIKNVSISNDAIVIAFDSAHDAKQNLHSVDISFAMPQAKGRSEILVSINEPTYSPIIQLSYPEATVSAKAFSFLNDGNESSLEQATHNAGNYEFCIQDKWIYPMSGVVFVIDEFNGD